jgi:hypothetical protein
MNGRILSNYAANTSAGQRLPGRRPGRGGHVSACERLAIAGASEAEPSFDAFP